MFLEILVKAVKTVVLKKLINNIGGISKLNVIKIILSC